LLWDTIERAKEGGLSSNNCPILGSTIGVARRKAKLTIYELAEKSGQTLENIIDLNLGTLPLSEAAKIAEVIRNILTIDEEEYERALFADSRKR
jgi:hypothetical protein